MATNSFPPHISELGSVIQRSLIALIMGMLPLAYSTASEIDARPVQLAGSQEWALKDVAGHDYRILVSEPEGEVPSNGFPVLYVLDANAWFPAFHAAKRVQSQYSGSIVIGIAYPGDSPLNFLRRAYDFSPPVEEQDNDPPQGGQDLFLDFLEQQLMPLVAERFPIDEHHQSLYGHSFGGMFALYALYTRPGLFAQTVASSPSLWWRDRYLLPHEREFTERVRAGDIDATHLGVALLVADGDSPQDQQDAQDLSKRLGQLADEGLRVSWRRYEGESHMSLPFRTTNPVLNEVLRVRR